MTVEIPVECSGFTAASGHSGLNGLRPETFSLASILRAAVVAGYPQLRNIPSPQFAQWRAAALAMAVRPEHGILRQPPEWGLLDPSEKGAISSLLGVAVTKLLVERLLGAPLFLFLDVHFNLRFPSGAPRIKPDFAALSPSQKWFSVEAKGRSRFNSATLRNGKNQARALGKVNGSVVDAAFVCVTSFRRGALQVRFDDPETDDGDTLEAEIKPLKALKHYYDGFYRFREFAIPEGTARVMDNHIEARVWYSQQLDMRLGLFPALEEALAEENSEDALSILDRIGDVPDDRRGESLGPDGIIAIPGESWHSE